MARNAERHKLKATFDKNVKLKSSAKFFALSYNESGNYFFGTVK